MENDLLEIQKLGLQIFIRNNLKWNWIDNAEIIPKINENEHLIEIRDPYNPQHRSYISIHKNEKKAILRQNGIKYYEFSVTPINNSSISIETKTNRKRIESIESIFIDNCEQHLSSFLIKLRQMSPYISTFETLSKDEKFKKALRYLDYKSRL